MVDAHVTQVLDFPTLQIDVDRQRAAKLGITQRDVANNMLTSLSGSGQTAPTYYLNPQNGVNHFVAVNTSLEKLESVADILNFPANPPAPNILPNTAVVTPSTMPGAQVTRIGDIATVRPGSSMNSINHYTIQRVINVAASVKGRDLGSTAAEIKKAIAECKGPAADHQDQFAWTE